MVLNIINNNYTEYVNTTKGISLGITGSLASIQFSLPY